MQWFWQGGQTSAHFGFCTLESGRSSGRCSPRLCCPRMPPSISAWSLTWLSEPALDLREMRTQMSELRERNTSRTESSQQSSSACTLSYGQGDNSIKSLQKQIYKGPMSQNSLSHCFRVCVKRPSLTCFVGSSLRNCLKAQWWTSAPCDVTTDSDTSRRLVTTPSEAVFQQHYFAPPLPSKHVETTNSLFI